MGSDEYQAIVKEVTDTLTVGVNGEIIAENKKLASNWNEVQENKKKIK